MLAEWIVFKIDGDEMVEVGQVFGYSDGRRIVVRWIDWHNRYIGCKEITSEPSKCLTGGTGASTVRSKPSLTLCE